MTVRGQAWVQLWLIVMTVLMVAVFGIFALWTIGSMP